MSLRLIWNDIVAEPADVIVTPASRKPEIGTGLDKAIHEVGGPKLTAARMGLGAIEPGVVKHTDAYGLAKAKCHAKYVIHALGPWFEQGKLNGTERPLLLGCYLQILCTAVTLKAKTVSIPVMSSGKFGMPMKLAVDTAVEAIRLFLQAVPSLKVKLVGIDPDFYAYAKEQYPELTEARIDEAVVEKYRTTHTRRRWEDDSECGEMLSDGEESAYFRSIRFRRDTDGKSFQQLFSELWLRVKAHDRKAMRADCRKYRLKKDSFRYLLNQVDLERRSGVPQRKIKRYLSASEQTVPPRDTVVLLSLALGVPTEYLHALLGSCGYPVSGAGLTRRDRLVLGMYEKGVYARGH